MSLMKKCLNITFLIMAVAILLASCTKSTEEFIADPIQPVTDTTWVTLTAPTSVDAYLKSNAAAAVTDSIRNDSITTRTYLSGKLRLTFPRYCFIDSTSAGAYDNVKIEVIAINSRGELLKSLISTRSTDSFNINTLFYVYVRATRNNVELPLLTDKRFLVEFDDANYLGNSQVYVAPSQGTSSNTPLYNTTNSVYFSIQTLGGTQGYRYRYYNDRTGWSMCGNTPTSSSTARIFTTLPIQFTNVNTRAYIVLNDSKTVIKMNDNVPGGYFELDRLPLAASFKIVTVSIINGVYYLGIGESSTSNNLIIQLHPVQSSPTSINSFLNNL